MSELPDCQEYDVVYIPLPPGNRQGLIKQRALFFGRIKPGPTTKPDSVMLVYRSLGLDEEILIGPCVWNGEHFEKIETNDFGRAAEGYPGLDIERCKRLL